MHVWNKRFNNSEGFFMHVLKILLEISSGSSTLSKLSWWIIPNTFDFDIIIGHKKGVR